MNNIVNLELVIPADEIDHYNRLMNVDRLDYEKNSIPRYSTIHSWTVNAGNGYEIDVKVCSSDDGDPLWCEAVLFLNGSEQMCTGVETKLDGKWTLITDNVSFVLKVKRGD